MLLSNQHRYRVQVELIKETVAVLYEVEMLPKTTGNSERMFAFSNL